MRLLFLTNLYPPNDLGGYEQWCQEVAIRLRERDWQVKILTSQYGDLTKTAIDEEHVTRSLFMETDINYYRPLDFFLNRPGHEKANLAELHRVIDQFSPDLIMVWGMWNLSLNLPYFAETWLPGRVAYYISSYWPMDTDPHTVYWNLPTNRRLNEFLKLPFRMLALRQLAREGYPPKLQFDHAVCCSEFVRDTLVAAGKLPAHAGVLYGGSDLQPFLQKVVRQKHDDAPLRLLYFGRLIFDKGVHTALEALGLLKQRGLADRVELTILGNGRSDYEAQLHKLVTTHNIEEYVKFEKWVSRDKIPQKLKQYDVYLFTSIWPEPMARSVMEAMAAGLLVIASRVGGQVEMLEDGQNALTFPAEDAMCLADHIATLLDKPSLRISLANEGQRTVLERFTLTRMVDEIEDYLKNVGEQAPAVWSKV
jgi:glycogen synthase